MMFQDLPTEPLQAFVHYPDDSPVEASESLRPIQRFECFDLEPVYPLDLVDLQHDSQPLSEDWIRLLAIWHCAQVESGL